MLYCEDKLQKVYVFLLAFSVSHFPYVSSAEHLHKYTSWASFSKNYRHIPIWVNIRYGGPSYNGLAGIFSIRYANRRENKLSVELGCHFCWVWHTEGEDKLKRSGAWIYGRTVSESRQCDSLTVLPYLLFLFCVFYERYCVNSVKLSINNHWTSRWFWLLNIASVCAAAPDSNSEVDGIKGEEERSRMLRYK
jgi:hypothetical protein